MITELPGMRPSKILALILAITVLADLWLIFHAVRLRAEFRNNKPMMDIVVSGLGLTDLCIATEARYTRHPAVTDPVVPFMNHPGAIEHFPTGSFWAAPPQLRL
jgi:hypothetical protein